MITLDGTELPEELMWADEFNWQIVQASAKRTIQGKFITQSTKAPSEAGRKMTLTSEYAWAARSLLELLHSWTEDPDLTMTLVMHDTSSHTVRFRHWDPPCIATEMVLPTAFPDADTYYNITLKLAIV